MLRGIQQLRALCATTCTLRIGLDLSPTAGHGSRGLAHVVHRLADALLASQRVELVPLMPPSGMSMLHWRHYELPRRAERDKLDVLHSCTSAYPVLAPCKLVQTIHELPWLHAEEEHAGWSHQLWAALGTRHAQLVATASEVVRAEIVANYHPQRVVAVPWGVDRPSSQSSERLRAFELRARDYVLVPGGGRTKKQAMRGLAALDTLGASAPVLVTTGAVDPAMAKPPARLRHLGAVSAEDMGALLEHAACVVVASRSEGFSLPVVEALARGTAVVVPAGTVQAEVAGPVAHVAASCAPEILAQAILQACASASESTLRAERQQYTARYSWDDTARRWEDAWLQM